MARTTTTPPSFFESLGLGNDQIGLSYEQALRQANPRQSERDAIYNRTYAGGHQGGMLIGGLIGAAAQKFGGVGVPEGQKRPGFSEAFSAITDYGKESFVAEQLGMPVEQLQKRKSLRNKIDSYELEQTDPVMRQAETLLRTAQDANAMGLTDVAQQAMQRYNALQRQQAELAKTDAETDKMNREGMPKAGNITPRNPDGSFGSPMSAVVDHYTGRAVAGDRVYGSNEYYLGDARMYDRKTDPAKADDPKRMFEGRYTASNLQGYRDLINTANQGLRVYGRTMSDIQDAMQSPEAAATFLSTAGRFSIAVDQVARNVNAFMRVLGREEVFDVRAERKLYEKWEKDALSGKLSGKIPLPPGIAPNSAAAQQYQANILGLAFMDARIEEPSGRGLSDRDIEAALVRNAGNSANPQSLLRNFAEKVAGNALNVENQMLTLSVPGVPRDLVYEAAGVGEAYNRYKDGVNSFMDQFGITGVDNYGRATFGAPVDTDVQPGEGPLPSRPPTQQEVNEIVDPELRSILGLPTN